MLATNPSSDDNSKTIDFQLKLDERRLLSSQVSTVDRVRRHKSLLVLLGEKLETDFEDLCAGRLKRESIETYIECLNLAVDSIEIVYSSLEREI